MLQKRFFPRAFGVALLLAQGACGVPAAPCVVPETGENVTLIDHGWHVDVGISADEISGPLAIFRDLFPGARAFVFGYGKKTFLSAPPDTISEYLLGPIPGPALIEVAALNVLPDAAYPADETITLRLPPGGARALSDFIGNDFEEDRDKKPLLVGPGNFLGSLFYAARGTYSLAHTCNTWAADALHAAGLPISGDGVAFSGDLISRAADARAAWCQDTSSHQGTVRPR